MNIPNLSDVGFSTKVVEPSGSGSSRIMLVGEAPGEFEDRLGVAFHPQAPAGGTLERLLKRAGYNRDQFRITNVVWQRPPRNWLEGSPWENRAIEAWRPFLEREIERMKPRVIVALGNTALKALTNYGGAGASITQVGGYVLSSHYDCWCVPTYHPSFILQGQQRLSGAFIYALHRAMEIATHGFARETYEHYLLDPTYEEMLEFERGYDPEKDVLSYDIETPRSSHLDEEDIEGEDESYNIIRASLCYASGRACSFPWASPYSEIAIRMLGSSGAKRVWNRLFDNPRLEANNAPIRGRCYDVMESWSFLQRSLPRGLAFVAPFYNWTGEPWKHLSDSNPPFYSACDADALHRIGEGTKRDLEASGRWERYERHVVDTYDVLLQMSRNGLPYSSERAKAFEIELQAKMDERMALLQQRVPDELKPSKQKNGLKRTPKDTTGYVQRKFKVLGSDMSEDEQANYDEYTVLGEPAPVYDHEIYTVTRWCILEPFLPTSPKQVMELIKHYGHKVGTNRKTKKETTDEDTIRKLATRLTHAKKEIDRELGSTLNMIRECRQLSKVLGTYVKGWRPGKDGRIHSTPGFWGSMYRISWRNPNIAATIADKDEGYIAAGFRKCVHSSPGKILLESDWKGIEALIVGYLAGDKEYMRLARLGVHDYLCAHLLVQRGKIPASDIPSLALPDKELVAIFKDLKKRFPKDRDDAKHTVHGTNYGMGPGLMADLYEMTMGDAKRLQALYFELYPLVKKWQDATIQRAHHEAKLINAYGYVMWFWNVLQWNSRYQRLELGDDAKSAISFLPRDSAAGMLKDVLLRLEQKYSLASNGIMLASTHDSITTECMTHDLDSIASIVKKEMEAPVDVLGGLVVGVEQKAGESWDSDAMESYEPTLVNA